MQEENSKPFPCIVADTSFMASYLLNGLCDDEFSDCIKDVEYILENNGQFYVPQLFWYEIYNVLLYKVRKNKGGTPVLTKSNAMDIMYDLQMLPIYTEPQADSEIRSRIFDLAVEYNLSYYDASYLELSRRYNLVLKTYDEDLKKALS
ncbi:MAG: type II toxin-antitoxin system VapC family toxin [Treponema sp.]|nr:type II toxin-antitoxin system VapC family toxin [Treponema sp.]